MRSSMGGLRSLDSSFLQKQSEVWSQALSFETHNNAGAEALSADRLNRDGRRRENAHTWNYIGVTM